MKKIFTILSITGAIISSNAQNLIQNSSFEDWSNPTERPSKWDGTNKDFTRSTNPVKSGNYAAGLTSKTNAKGGNVTVSATATDVKVEAGKTYTFSGWYLDNVPNASFKYWGQWRTDSERINGENSLQTSANLEEGAEWKQFTVDAIAPATATIARLSLRVFNQDGKVGGTVFFDDISFVGKSSLSTEDIKEFDSQVKMNTIVTDRLHLILPQKSTVNIYSMDGKLISSNRVSNNETINTSYLSPGYYLVTINNGISKINRKILKK